MPKDPMMLFSYVNMKLRDNGISLDELCASEGVTRQDVEKILSDVGFVYDSELRKFIMKG